MSDYKYPVTAHSLVNATHSGNLAEVQRLVESGIHPDDYTGNVMPALTCAASNGNYKIVEYLLSKGANPNNYTDDKLSALKSASKSKSTKIVKLLLEAGADPNYERDGEVALTLACDDAKGNKELVKLLLDVTDKKYYQKAYEYLEDETIRNMIKEHAPEIEFMDPDNGFGGPTYKQHVHYETPPRDPLLRQLWELMDIYANRMHDPNRGIFGIFYKMDISDNPKSQFKDGKLQLSYNAIDMLKFVFNLKDPEVSKEDYAEIYQMVLDYKSESDEDDNDENLNE